MKPTKSLFPNLDELLADDFSHAECQYAHTLRAISDPKRIPRTFENGGLVTGFYEDWTSGFFPGSLWLVYEYTRSPKWKKAALDYTARVAPASRMTNTHDVGFMIYCSHGQALRLAGGRQHRDVLLEAARSLAARFNPAVRAIRSWDFGTHRWKYPVIIDNMMNLELLMWAARETGNAHFSDIAISHAHQTLVHHFRQDGSSYHLVDFDPLSGKVLLKETVQGCANESAWARGQSWALYGYTMMYRETHNPVYLEQARHIARYLTTHARMPADKIPQWDFDAPLSPHTPRDTSAASIMASALIELSGYLDEDMSLRYLAYAWEQIKALSSPAYRAAPGEIGGFLLKHGTGHLGRGIEIGAPLAYGDYYYLEALHRLKTAANAGGLGANNPRNGKASAPRSRAAGMANGASA